MKYLAMAVCIFVFQSTTHQPSAHPQTKKSDSNPVPIQSGASAPQPAQPIQSNQERTGKELSNIPKDDRALLWAGVAVNVVLALATIVLAIFAVVQAQATKRSVEVLVEGQRPRLAVEPHGLPTKDLADRLAPRVQLSLANRGLTTAYDCLYESWIELLPFPFNDFSPSADHFKATDRLAIYPNHSAVILNIPISQGLTDGQLSDLKQMRCYACIRIRVTYRDAFNTNRYANFGLYVLHNGLGFLPKYNDAN
jgi:hypothetical protein